MNKYTHRIVNGEEVPLTPEEIAECEAQAVAAQAAAEQQAVRDQIRALEDQQTLRRMRDAFSSDEGKAWLMNLESQIATLRAQLVS